MDKYLQKLIAENDKMIAENNRTIRLNKYVLTPFFGGISIFGFVRFVSLLWTHIK